MVLHKEETVLSPWVTLVTKVILPDWHTSNQVYHSLKQADYVSVLAMTSDGRIPLVKQYRPALEKVTLELPGGLLEKGEQPDFAAQEETGFEAPNGVELLGCLAPDTGRLENRLWCYFAPDVVSQGTALHQLDPGVESVIYPVAELYDAVLDGSFEHALHVAIIGLALLRGRLTVGEIKNLSTR